MTYTVILLYPDYAANDYGSDLYTTSVDSNTPKEAAAAAQSEAAYANNRIPANPPILPEDFKVIAVMQGCIDMEDFE